VGAHRYIIFPIAHLNSGTWQVVVVRYIISSIAHLSSRTWLMGEQ